MLLGKGREKAEVNLMQKDEKPVLKDVILINMTISSKMELIISSVKSCKKSNSFEMAEV